MCGGVEDFVDADNWAQLVPADVDAVIDACDQVKAKTAMAAWARQHGKLLVVCGAAGGKRQAQAVQVADLGAVTHDPLLAQVRYRLRKEHGAPQAPKGHGKTAKLGVPCVFSQEAVAPPNASCAVEGDGSLNCHGYGSAVTVTATFGMCAAGVVIERLAAGQGAA